MRVKLASAVVPAIVVHRAMKPAGRNQQMTRSEIITAQTALNVKLNAINAEEAGLGWTDADIQHRQDLMDTRAANRAEFKTLARQRVAI